MATQTEAPPARDRHHGNQTTTQLEFHQAMRDFRTMFPDMDDEVIEAVLRSNQGAVDATIDQLLAMATDNENERLRTEMDAAENAEPPPNYSPTTPPPSYHQAVPYTNQTQSRTDERTPTKSIKQKSTQQAETAVDRVDSGANNQQTSTDEILLLDIGGVAVEGAKGGGGSPFSSPGKANAKIAEGAVGGFESNFVCNPSSDKEPVDCLTTPLRQVRNWKPPVLGSLAKDFLRVRVSRVITHRVSTRGLGRPQNKHHRLVCIGQELSAGLSTELLQQKLKENERQKLQLEKGALEDPQLARHLEDERVALFLQNEEFMQELKRNKDFMTTLDRDTRHRMKTKTSLPDQLETAIVEENAVNDDDSSEDECPPDEVVGSSSYTHNKDPESDDVFREKLKNMGKVSKRKFAQLAKLFSRRKKGSGKRILSESVQSRDNLLVDDDSYQEDSTEEPEVDSALSSSNRNSDNFAAFGTSGLQSNGTKAAGRL